MPIPFIVRLKLLFHEKSQRYGKWITGFAIFWSVVSWINDNLDRVEFLGHQIVRIKHTIQHALPFVFDLIQELTRQHWVVVLGNILESPIGPIVVAFLGVTLMVYGKFGARHAQRYVVATSAFRLVDEATRYLENNKLPPYRRPPPWILAAGGRIPPDQTPEARMARDYREVFGARLKELIDQLREIGITLPQRDEVYFAPSRYSWVPLTICQIKDAANRLASSLEQAKKADEK